jgi:uncharacterized repeat protein (TIGR04042 family)
MPEMRFEIEWPDGTRENCYSPSLVIKDYLAPGTVYTLAEFLQRGRTALQTASARVQEKYGFPCARALGQLRQIETVASRFIEIPDAAIKIIAFYE